MDSKRMSRRRFVASCAAMATGLMAAACAPKVVEKVVTKAVPVEVTKIVKEVVKETVIVEGTPQVVEKEVTRIVKETLVVEEAPEFVAISVGISEHPAQPIISDAPAHLALTEHTGVILNFIVPSDYDVKQQLWLATNTAPDIMEAGLASIRDFVGEGVLLPLGPLIDEHAPNLKRYIDTYPEIEKLKIDGELYYVPEQRFNAKGQSSMPMIRTDILEKLGLEKPTTFEELFEVLKAFKKAYPDSLVWANRYGSARLLVLNAYPMGSGAGQAWSDNRTMYFDKDVDGGKWLFGAIHPEFRYVLDYFARAYAEGILDPDFAVTTADQWHEKNSSGKALYCWENMTFGVRWNLALREVDPEATWAPIYVLEGPKGKRFVGGRGGLGGGWVIGASTKYPVQIIKMFDWMITPLGLDVTNWGVEGAQYTLKGTRPETIEDYTIAGISKAQDPTKKEMLPEVHKYFGEMRDPWRSYQSETGTGHLDFIMLCDEAIEYMWAEAGETDAWYETTATDPGLHRGTLEPPFTAEESAVIKEARTNTDNILNPAYDKVIIGQMSLAEYDQVVKQAIEAGAEEMEKIYNAAEARLK